MKIVKRYLDKKRQEQHQQDIENCINFTIKSILYSASEFNHTEQGHIVSEINKKFISLKNEEKSRFNEEYNEIEISLQNLNS